MDLERRTLTILEQKNGARDTLPVNVTTMEVLQARAAVRTDSTEAVFVNEAGHPRDARNLLRSFYPAMRKAGIVRFRFHDLRHTFATRLIQAGVDGVALCASSAGKFARRGGGAGSTAARK